MGIAQASIVHDEDSLRARVEFIHRNLGTDAIAEQYIDGRELNIGVLGNERLTVLPVREVKFENLPDGAAPILTAKGKWDLAYQERIGLSSGRADLPEPLARELARNAKRIYRALGLSGFARIDVRLAADGSAYVLEANPNPDLCRHEDFAAAALEAGLPYDALIQRITALGCGYLPAWKRG
jgi:D-alanine-D-alanine ligase